MGWIIRQIHISFNREKCYDEAFHLTEFLYNLGRWALRGMTSISLSVITLILKDNI